MTLAPEWRRDVALELWIDREGPKIRIRLVGRLTRATVSTLVLSVKEFVAEGGRDFEIQAPNLPMPDLSVTDILGCLEASVHASGGRWCWGHHDVGCEHLPKSDVGV